MKKDKLMEILNSKKQQIEDVLSLPAPTTPWLHQGYLRRQANAKYFLAELLEVISIVETLDEVQLVQVHAFRQYLRSARFYKHEYNGSYCHLATVQSSSHETQNLLAISSVDLL